MNSVKISPKEASELIALGYEIECHLILPEVSKVKIPVRAAMRHIPMGARFTLSLDGVEPSKGKYMEVWIKLKRKLWTDEVTKIYTRKEIQKAIDLLTPKLDRAYFAYLANSKKCIRCVD